LANLETPTIKLSFLPQHLTRLRKTLEREGAVAIEIDPPDPSQWLNWFNALFKGDELLSVTVRKILQAMPRIIDDKSFVWGIDEVYALLLPKTNLSHIRHLTCLWFQLPNERLSNHLKKMLLNKGVKIPAQWKWVQDSLKDYKSMKPELWYSKKWSRRVELEELYKELRVKKYWDFGNQLEHFWFKHITQEKWNYLVESKFELLKNMNNDRFHHSIENLSQWMIKQKMGHSKHDRPGVLLREILTRFGKVPVKKSTKAAYDKFSDPVFEDLKRWYMMDNIQSFFTGVAGDFYRLQFWMEMLELGIIDFAEKYDYITAFQFKIGNLYFIEFGEVGNALYIYEEFKFLNLRTKPRSVGDLKNQFTCKDRMAHYGSERGAWQNNVRNFIDRNTSLNPYRKPKKRRGIFRSYRR